MGYDLLHVFINVAQSSEAALLHIKSSAANDHSCFVYIYVLKINISREGQAISKSFAVIPSA